MVLAKTITDGAGQVTFPDVPAGRYVVKATRPGFVPTDSAPFDVRAGETAQVLLDIQLTFVAPSVEVRAPTSPTQSVQPVSTSDMLSGSVLDIAPLEGDDFQSLLPLLPGVVRGPDGRLRAKGGQPTQGALQISSASLIDPSTGDFDLELPGQSLESVEVLANPFAAEYGRFSTSVDADSHQARHQRLGDQAGQPHAAVPQGVQRHARVRAALLDPRAAPEETGCSSRRTSSSATSTIRSRACRTSRTSGSRASIRSPASTACSRRGIRSAASSSCSRARSSISTMNTFRPPEVTPEFNQSGASIGVQDRFALSPTMVLESTLAGRWFEINVNTDGRQPMIYAPETQQGSFFNDQEREVSSVQWVEALSLSRRQVARPARVQVRPRFPGLAATTARA